MTQESAPAELSPEMLAKQIEAAAKAGTHTQPMEAAKVEQTVATVISGLVEQLAKQGGVEIGTLNVNIGSQR